MTDDVSFIKIWEGEDIKIDAIQINKKCYFDIQKLSDQDQKKVFALFHLLEKRGRLSAQKLKKLHFNCKGCFEFKPTSQLRISFIYLQNHSGIRHICLLDGFRKKRDRWPKQKVEKTERLCKKVKEYENNKGRNLCLN